MIYGVDVSRWQGYIDWKKVKAAGIEFAMIRASYGLTAIDPYFNRNVINAGNAGIYPGAYHYCYADTVQKSEAEAEHFLNTIYGHQLLYPAVLDLEDESLSALSKQQLTDIAKAFLYKVQDAGYFTMLYANKNWLENKLDMAQLGAFAVWLAQYTEGDYTYRGSIGMWQYTDSARIDGINGSVDRDKSFYDYAKIIREKGLNHSKGDSMTVEEAKKIIQQKTGFDQNTMLYLEFYRYSESMLIRMAQAMQ